MFPSTPDRHSAGPGRRLLDAIGQIMLIVIGVTLALAADSWRESMTERRLEQSFLDRLVDDLETQLLEFEEAREQGGHSLEHGLAVLPFVRGESAAGSAIGILGSAYHASRPSVTIELVDHTYVELLSSGGFGVITDPEIRTAVVDFYRRYANGSSRELRASSVAAYYTAVRSRIPVGIQGAIRQVMDSGRTQGCGLSDAPLDCHLDVDSATAASAAAELVDPEVARSLNLWLQRLVSERDLADTYEPLVRQVLSTIEKNRR